MDLLLSLLATSDNMGLQTLRLRCLLQGRLSLCFALPLLQGSCQAQLQDRLLFGRLLHSPKAGSLVLQDRPHPLVNGSQFAHCAAAESGWSRAPSACAWGQCIPQQHQLQQQQGPLEPVNPVEGWELV